MGSTLMLDADQEEFSNLHLARSISKGPSRAVAGLSFLRPYSSNSLLHAD